MYLCKVLGLVETMFTDEVFDKFCRELESTKDRKAGQVLVDAFENQYGDQVRKQLSEKRYRSKVPEDFGKAFASHLKHEPRAQTGTPWFAFRYVRIPGTETTFFDVVNKAKKLARGCNVQRTSDEFNWDVYKDLDTKVYDGDRKCVESLVHSFEKVYGDQVREQLRKNRYPNMASVPKDFGKAYASLLKRYPDETHFNVFDRVDLPGIGDSLRNLLAKAFVSDDVKTAPKKRKAKKTTPAPKQVAKKCVVNHVPPSDTFTVDALNDLSKNLKHATHECAEAVVYFLEKAYGDQVRKTLFERQLKREDVPKDFSKAYTSLLRKFPNKSTEYLYRYTVLPGYTTTLYGFLVRALSRVKKDPKIKKAPLRVTAEPVPTPVRDVTREIKNLVQLSDRLGKKLQTMSNAYSRR